VAPDGFLYVSGEVATQVPAICHLDRLRRTGCRAFGVGAGTISANHLRSGMIP
jgi:hypothetical protein